MACVNQACNGKLNHHISSNPSRCAGRQINQLIYWTYVRNEKIFSRFFWRKKEAEGLASPEKSLDIKKF